MPGRKGSRARLLPWLALLSLFVADYAAGKAEKAEKKWDVKDTHERLDRIYEKMGYSRDEPEESGCQPEEECCETGGAGGGVGGGGKGGKGKGGKGKGQCKGGAGGDQGSGKGEGGQDGKDGKDGKGGKGGKGGKKAKGGKKKCVDCGPKERPQINVPAWVGYLLIGIILAAMLIPLIFVLRNAYREDKDQPKLPDVELEEPEEERAELGPWVVDLSECRRLFNAGRLAEAFASLHRLTLLNLEKRQDLILDETTTNWEYVRRLASKPSLKEALAKVTVAAEQSVLGRAPPRPEQYEVLERLVVQRLQERRP